MVGKPQTLSKRQQEEVVNILRKKLLKWTSICFVFLTGVTGLSLWGIKERVESKMEKQVAKQFEEPRIQEVVRQSAAERADTMMQNQIEPEVARAKREIQAQLVDVQSAVDKIQKMAAPPSLSLHQKSISTDAGLYAVVMKFKPSKIMLLGPVELHAEIQGSSEAKIVDFWPTGPAFLAGDQSKRIQDDGKVARLEYQLIGFSYPQVELKLSSPAIVKIQGNHGIEPFTLEVK